MPSYDYSCDACGFKFRASHSIINKLTDCTECNTVDSGSIIQQTVCLQIEHYRTHSSGRFCRRISHVLLLPYQVDQVCLIHVDTMGVHNCYLQKSVVGLNSGSASCSLNLQVFKSQFSVHAMPVSPEQRFLRTRTVVAPRLASVC